MIKILEGAGIIVLFFFLMISPCLQIILSTSKKKFVWIIMPVITLVIMGTIAYFSTWRMIIKVLFALSVPVVLLIFHIFVKKNLFH